MSVPDPNHEISEHIGSDAFDIAFEVFDIHTAVQLSPYDGCEESVHPITEGNLIRALSAVYDVGFAAGKVSQ